jgi:hypothetical protein
MTKKGLLTGIIGFKAPKGRGPDQPIPVANSKHRRLKAINASLVNANEPTLQRVEAALGLGPRRESPDAGRPMTPVKDRGMHE